jgi:cystathionine beta-lyase
MAHAGGNDFDFDAPVDRRTSWSLKWDRYRGRDILPMWVADMDFQAPPAVLEALRERVDHGVFGYTLPSDDLVDAVLAMLRSAHAWEVRPEWIVWLPGLVSGLSVACLCAGEPGDAVMTTTPAYPPILRAPSLASRRLITVPHVSEPSGYTFDFDLMEHSVTERTRMFVLCNPHNPTGRVFTRDELKNLAGMCLDRDIIICSDEIHCGLVLDHDRVHLSIAALDGEVARRSITLLAPSKTYNLPGLGCSLAVIPDSALRSRFRQAMAGIVPHVNALGLTAALAAYRDSEGWRLALVDYLRGSRDLVEAFVASSPGLAMRHVEATYLAWIDCRGLGHEDPAAFFEQAGVGLSSGVDFGTPGFVRLNFGCSRSLVNEALTRLGSALRQRAEAPEP